MIADAPAPPPPPLAAVKAALVRRLDSEHLSFRYVVCFRDPHVFRGQAVSRCRVDFGEPHLVQYCSVLTGRRLVTDHENRAILCGAHPDVTLTGADPRSFAR